MYACHVLMLAMHVIIFVRALSVCMCWLGGVGVGALRCVCVGYVCESLIYTRTHAHIHTNTHIHTTHTHAHAVLWPSSIALHLNLRQRRLVHHWYRGAVFMCVRQGCWVGACVCVNCLSDRLPYIHNRKPAQAGRVTQPV